LEVSHWRAALATTLVMAIGACTAGSTTNGRGVARTNYVPPDRYDAVIFFCPRTFLPPDCPRPATPADIARMRRSLLADDIVRGIVYVSADQAVALERQTLTVSPQLVQPGDLPASFSVALAHTDFPALRRRYASAPGVEFVQLCGVDRPVCDVDALRSVGALR
jgi:hypothetical protein